VKPLGEFRILVLADAQRRNIAINGMNDDITAIEGGIDVRNWHFGFALAMKFMARG
jgi:hypothetical protein